MNIQSKNTWQDISVTASQRAQTALWKAPFFTTQFNKRNKKCLLFTFSSQYLHSVVRSDFCGKGLSWLFKNWNSEEGSHFIITRILDNASNWIVTGFQSVETYYLHLWWNSYFICCKSLFTGLLTERIAASIVMSLSSSLSRVMTQQYNHS